MLNTTLFVLLIAKYFDPKFHHQAKYYLKHVKTSIVSFTKLRSRFLVLVLFYLSCFYVIK